VKERGRFGRANAPPLTSDHTGAGGKGWKKSNGGCARDHLGIKIEQKNKRVRNYKGERGGGHTITRVGGGMNKSSIEG